jgi:uncharacterized membrane protein HdeD (DUF308 family)
MKRPVEVAILGWLFIIVGTVNLGYPLLKHPFDLWTVPASLVGVIAVVAGMFLLKGRGWSRWVLIAWLLFHVLVGAFISVSAALAHAALLIAVAYALLASPASMYFETKST